MKTYLLPRYFRPIGFVLAIPGFILGVLFLCFDLTIPGFGPENPLSFTVKIDNYTNELALTLVIVGVMFIAFAKLKNEDELTSKLRLNALYWAILVNYVLVICLAIAAAFSLEFRKIGFNINYLDSNLYAPLLAFIIRFYYLLHKKREEYYIAPLRFLPHTPYNRLARALLIPCIAIYAICSAHSLGVLFSESEWTKYLDAIYIILPLVLLMWIYSNESIEDEYINSLRLQAMQITVYINSLILLIANFALYSLEFLLFEIVALSVLPLLFIIIFQYKLYRLSNNTGDGNKKTLNVNTL